MEKETWREAFQNKGSRYAQSPIEVREVVQWLRCKATKISNTELGVEPNVAETMLLTFARLCLALDKYRRAYQINQKAKDNMIAALSRKTLFDVAVVEFDRLNDAAGTWFSWQRELLSIEKHAGQVNIMNAMSILRENFDEQETQFNRLIAAQKMEEDEQ